jgi:mono/diheme cytochrome c family protein
MIARFALALGLIAGPVFGAVPDWSDIGALFAARCTKCHSGNDAPMGLSLDSYEGAVSGGWSGKVLLPGDVAGSPLIARLRGEVTPRMPLDGPPFLTEQEISTVVMWIEAGLPKGNGGVDIAVPERERPEPGSQVTFADVEPIFLKSCIKCHSDNSKLSAPPEGLRLDSLDYILRGGERLAIVPGNPEMSEIWRRVVGLADPRMPFDGPPWLADDDIRLIRDWIDQGAQDAEGNRAPMLTGAKIRLRGILTAPNAIDGAVFSVDDRTRIDKSPEVGAPAEMRGEVQADGSVTATRLRRR